MSALVNPYFKKDTNLEQNMLRSMIDEAIQVLGRKYYYLPRKIQHEDLILGEDVISKFDFSLEIELYQTHQQGWNPDESLMSKFGVTLSSQITFIMSKSAWDNEIKSYPSVESMKLGGYRPQEGDLIYEPVSKSLLEIKFVKNTNSDFFQFGQVYQFELTCEFFQYSSEVIETGNPDIDLFSKLTEDILVEQIITEDGMYNITQEDGSYILQDLLEEPLSREYGTNYEQEAIKIDFQISNPFDQ